MKKNKKKFEKIFSDVEKNKKIFDIEKNQKFLDTEYPDQN